MLPGHEAQRQPPRPPAALGKDSNIFEKLDAIAALTMTDIQKKAILSRVARYAGDQNECFASRERLAADVSISTRQLRFHLNDLIKSKLILQTRHRRQIATLALGFDAFNALFERRQTASLKPVSRPAAGRHSKPQDRRSSVGKTGGTPPTEEAEKHSSSKKEANRPGTTRKLGGTGSALHNLDPGEFKTISRGLARYEACVATGEIIEAEKVDFLSLWLWAGRDRAGNPSAAFISCLNQRPQREWHRDHEQEVLDVLDVRQLPVVTKITRAKRVDDDREAENDALFEFDTLAEPVAC